MFLPPPRKSAYAARKDGSYPWLQTGLRLCTSVEDVDEFWATHSALIGQLPEGWQQMLSEEKDRLKSCHQVQLEERERFRQWRLIVG